MEGEREKEREREAHRNYSISPSSEPAPTSENTTQVKEVSIDIGEPMHKAVSLYIA